MNSKQIVSRKHLRSERQTERARALRARALCVYLEAEVFSRYYLFTIHYLLLSYKKHFCKNIYVCVKTG